MTAGNGHSDEGHGLIRMKVREVLADCGEKLHILGAEAEKRGHLKLATTIRALAEYMFAARRDTRGPREDL